MRKPQRPSVKICDLRLIRLIHPWQSVRENMPSIPVYNPQGEKTGELAVSQAVFGVKAKPALLHQVVVALQAAMRPHVADTKTRGEVRGGGKKPWKQKGTGRARVGSIRSPLWRKGGVIFGPKSIQNFEKKVNKKVRKAAFCMALSDKAADGRIIALEPFAFEAAKTKFAHGFLKKLPLHGKREIVVYGNRDEATVRAFRNIPSVALSHVDTVNTRDVLKAGAVITSKEAVAALEKRYAAGK